MEIKYYIKGVYGREMMYIKDKVIAEYVSLLTGRKTITETDIEALTHLGFKLIRVLR